MNETKFRVGTYIDDSGDKKWQIERFYPEDGAAGIQVKARWVLFQQSLNRREDAMKSIKIFRMKESHDPKWQVV